MFKWIAEADIYRTLKALREETDEEKKAALREKLVRLREIADEPDMIGFVTAGRDS